MEYKLDSEEASALQKSAEAVRQTLDALSKLVKILMVMKPRRKHEHQR